jgi:LPS sulfotransferase NodH
MAAVNDLDDADLDTGTDTGDGAATSSSPIWAPDLDARWLGGTGEARIGEFLASRAATTHLVMPRALVDALPPDPTGGFTHSEALDGIGEAARVVIVGSTTQEATLLAQARERLPGRRILGLHHHVLPMRVSDRQPLKDVPPSFRIADAQPYAIVCPARSGSTFLCGLLRDAGFGRPREHLRRPLALALRTPGVDTREVWRQVAGRAQQRGIFGTKLVAQFLDDAAGGRPLTDTLAPLTDEGARIVLLRRPALDSTVSRFLAGRAQRFHARGELKAEDRARFEAVGYDFAALREILVRNLDENERLAAAVEALPAERVLKIDYADLDRDPLPTLERVADFLGRAAKTDAVDFGHLTTRISAQIGNSAITRARFLEDLATRDTTLAARLAADSAADPATA